MYSPQCVTRKSVRVDELDGFVRARGRDRSITYSDRVLCRDEWWENVVHLSFDKCVKSNRARQSISRDLRESAGFSWVFLFSRKSANALQVFDFEETVHAQYLIKRKEFTIKAFPRS